MQTFPAPYNRVMATEIIVRSLSGAKYTQEVDAASHTLYADEPVEYGGADKGPGPYEWLLAALGS